MQDNDTTISVPLTVEERAQRADIMAGLVGQIHAVKAQAKAKAFEFREAIEALIDRLEEHARVLRAGEEGRSQLDLTFPEEQAARALHDVVEHAECSCEGGPEADVKSPTCAVHGVDAQPARVSAACDGDHAAPQCADPECWLVVGPADVESLAARVIGAGFVPEALEAISRVKAGEEPGAVAEDIAARVEPSNVVDMADARALKAAEVEVGTVEEPAAVRRATRRRL